MAEYVVAVSRPGYDVLDPALARSNHVFHSDNATFKIAQNLSFTGSGNQAHGLNYPPTTLHYREINSGKWYGGNDGYNLGGSSNIYSDSANVYYNDSVNAHVFVLIDPLNEPTGTPPITRPAYDVAISKPGKDVLTCPPYDLAFSAQFDTFKVLTSQSLSISLPNETLTDTVKTYTATYSHNLGYPPVFLPQVIEVLNQNEPTNSTATWDVNNESLVLLPGGGFSPALAGESASIYVTTTQIVFEVTRFEFAVSPADFGAHTAQVDVTLFYNQINETVSFI